MLYSGIIALWHSTLGSIPKGWVLCDGNNGTPDLTDKFIMGADSGNPPGSSGGSVNHTHPFTSDSHRHSFLAGSGLTGGPGLSTYTSYEVDTGTTDNGSSLPPYYVLAYIMKT